MKKVTHEEFLGLPSGATAAEADRHCQTLLDWLSAQETPSALQPWLRAQRSIIGEMRQELGRAGAAGAADRQREASRSFPSRLRGSRWVLALAGVLVGLVVVGGWEARGLIGDRVFKGDKAAQEQEEPFDAQAFLASHEQQIVEMKATVNANPQDVSALFDLGETYIIGEQWQSAIDWFTKLLAVDPTNVHAQVDVGTANMNLGRTDEAEAAFLKALDLDPTSTQVHYNLGFLYAFRREPPNTEQAMAHWQEVTRLSPGSNLASSAEVHISQVRAAQLTP